MVPSSSTTSIASGENCSNRCARELISAITDPKTRHGSAKLDLLVH
jgi:hypothetical protein